MIPSANSTENQAGNLCWQSAETWQDQGVIPSVCSGLEARYFHSTRQPDWDWESAMILAQQTANGCEGDEEGDYKTGVMQAEDMGGVPSLRQYEGLLSATVNPSTLSLSPNTWGLLSTVGNRDASSSGFQGSSNPSCSSLGATWIDGYVGGNGSSFYGDSRSSLLGLVNFDHRRLENIVKRELGSKGDFNSRIGLNLGGRTYFSADDYAFGRFGKRPRPNSPGPQALCQAEGCKADLRIAKHYHRRHKVCEYHSKAATVLIRGQTQRFCQQCSRFHFLSEFDDGKRSCRKRLADHNRRRRKPQHSPSAVTYTTDQTIAQKNESEEAAASENNRNGSLSKGSPTSTEQGLAIPRATSASTLSREHGRQVSTLSERNDQKAINQTPLPGNCSAGPSLSLTSSGGVSHGVNGQKPSTGEKYGKLDLSVKWLPPGNSGTKFAESDVPRSDCSPNAYTERPNVSGMKDGRTSNQNVGSLQTSRDPLENTDWIIKSIAQRGSKQLEAFSSANRRLEGKDGQNVLHLLDRDNEKDVQTTNKYREETVHPTLRFLEEPIRSTASVNRMSDKPIDCWEPSWCHGSISARPQAAKQIDLQQR